MNHMKKKSVTKYPHVCSSAQIWIYLGVLMHSSELKTVFPSPQMNHMEMTARITQPMA